MTGLDPEKDRIIEIATIVTDLHLNILAEGPVLAIIIGFLIHQGYLAFLPSYIILIFGDIIPDSAYYYLGRLGKHKNIIEKYGSKCCQCGWNTPHPKTGKPPLDVNHIDGDASNTYEDNLNLLCPNCHSLTLNYKNFNKNGKRNR